MPLKVTIRKDNHNVAIILYISNRKLLLFEVDRKSKSNLNHAITMASLLGKEIVSAYAPILEIDWNNPIFEKYGCMVSWMDMARIRCFRSIKNCTLEL